MLRFLDCVNFLAPEGRQVCRNLDTPNSKAPEGRKVDNCVRYLPRENRVTRPKTLNLIPMGRSGTFHLTEDKRMSPSKDKIKNALQRFSDGNLADNARNLLNVLGYHSERRIDIEPNTADEFLSVFDSDDKINADRALLKEWESIDFLFQLTEDEITQSAQTTFNFGNSGVDEKGYESYLFFALKLRNQDYTRTQLSDITREINKLLMIPAMVMFQHGDALTFAVIDRRLHKRDESKDVLEKVTLIKDIVFAGPHRAHIDILFDLSLGELHRQHSFTDFPGLHQAWEKTLDTSQLNIQYYRDIPTWYFSADDQVTFPDGIDLAEVWYRIGCSRSELTELKIENSEEHLYTDEECELYDGAISAYRKAIEIQSDYVCARKSLAELLVYLAEKQSEDISWPSDYSQAIHWCKQAIEACPDFAPAYYALIQVYDSLMEDAEIDKWDDSILMDQIGLMSHEIVEKRIEVCHKLTEIQPNDAKAYYKLGLAYTRSIYPLIELSEEYGDETEDEIEAMREGKHPKIQSILENTIKAYGKAINIEPSYAAAYNEQAKVLSRLGRYQEAVQKFKQANVLVNLYRSGNAHGRAELIYIESSSWDFYDFREKRIPYNLAEAYHDLGKQNSADGNYTQAIECYHSAISVAPNYDAVYYDLGVAFDETGAYELAVVWYAHVTHAYDYPDFHYRFGKALHRIRRYTEAVEEYQKAINCKEAIEEEYVKNIDYKMSIGYFKTHDVEPLRCPAWWYDVYQDLEYAANNDPPHSS